MFFLHIVTILISIIVCDGKVPSKIINGETASIEEYPFIVSIQWQNHHICSGTLVSLLWVLTAQNCVYSLDPQDNLHSANLKVIAGTNDKLNTHGNGHIRDVALTFYNYKLALLKLHSPFVRSTSIQPIPISTDENYFTDFLKTAGWGDVSESQETQYLQKMKLKYISQEICDSLIGFSRYSLDKCAKSIYPHQKLSPGDGGSPIIFDNILVGIVTTRIVTNIKYITIANVWEYIDWIRSETSIENEN